MIPHERSLVKKLENKPFVLVGVNSDPTREKLKSVLEKEHITWPQFFDGGGTSGPIASKWNVHGWPTTYVIDAEGIIRHKDLRDDEAEKAIEALLAKMPASGDPRPN